MHNTSAPSHYHNPVKHANTSLDTLDQLCYDQVSGSACQIRSSSSGYKQQQHLHI